MKISDIPFDMSFSFDENLKEVPKNKEEMCKGIEYLMKMESKLPKDSAAHANLLSLVGGFYRIVEDLSKSEEYLTKALDLFKKHSMLKHAVQTKLRLACTWQWQNKFFESDKLFKELLLIIQKNEELAEFEDFVYQHMGKSKFDQRSYQESIDCFIKALELRINKGDMDLINSTQDSIAIVRKKIEI